MSKDGNKATLDDTKLPSFLPPELTTADGGSPRGSGAPVSVYAGAPLLSVPTDGTIPGPRPGSPAGQDHLKGTLTQHMEALTSLRGLLIVLVLLGHCSNPFLAAVPAADGPVWSLWLRTLTGLMSVFRMPAFFIVSGIVAYPSILRRKVPAYLRRRLFRLGVPLLFALILINPIDVFLRVHCSAYLGRWQPTPLQQGMLPGLFHGTSLFHLWYVIALFQVALVSGWMARAARALAGAEASRPAPRLRGWLVLITLPVVCYAGQSLCARLQSGQSFLRATGLLDVSKFILAFTWVMAGMVIVAVPGLLDDLRSAVRRNLAAVGVGAAVLLLVSGRSGLPMLALERAVTHILPLPIFGLLLACCGAGDGMKRAFHRFGKASYTIYIVHPLLVMAVAIGLKHLVGGDSLWAFLATAGIALPLSYWVHALVVERSAWMALLLNGKPLRRPE